MESVCPRCGKPFNDYLHLKSKEDIYLCNTCGLFYYKDNKWNMVKYPCPKCKSNYKEPYKTEGTWVYCKCEIHGEWKVSFLRSFKFRRLCSIAASKPNKDSRYYTPPEVRAKKILDSMGLRENIDYYHNKRIRVGKGRYYYPDFIVFDKIVFGVDPSIWHTMWNRDDNAKITYLKKLGYEYVSLSDKNEREWERIISRSLKSLRDE